MWWKYIKPYLPYFIFGPICMIIEVIGEVFLPKMLAMIIDYGIADGTEVEEKSAVAEWLLDKLGVNWQFIVAVTVGMIVTAILMMLGGIGGSYFGTKASVNFASDLRADLYSRVQKYSFSNIDKYSTGSLVTRLTNDVTQLQNFVMMCLRLALRAPGMLIGGVIMAFVTSPRLSLVFVVAIPLLLCAISFFILKGFPRFAIVQTKLDGLNSNVQENITNMRVVKSFVREDYEKEKFSQINHGYKKASVDAFSYLICIMPVMTLFMNLSTMAVLWFGGSMVINESGLSTGDLTCFITYITQILGSLMMVTIVFMQLSRAMACSKRVKEVLNEQIDISDHESICKEKLVESGSVEFRDVSYKYYKNNDEYVLKHISFSVKSGETVGIIGSTGCGKTTLVSMIPRLYDVDEGEVLVDGVNVKDYSLHHLREGVGMVLQKNVLFSGTIMDNLRWGDENASEDEIRSAAEIAQADQFITSFTNGYSSDIEQGGTNVSGGQKQRLCIARAFLKHPKILILDDSTSAVDMATEARIREGFKTTLKDTTKIIIAQRITSVMNADKIIVLNEGEITGIGSHEELMSSNVEYQEIYSSQMEQSSEGVRL